MSAKTCRSRSWMAGGARTLLGLLVCLALSRGTTARGATLSATLQPATIGLGDTAELTLQFIGGAPQNLDQVSLPTVQNLTFRYAGQGVRTVQVNTSITTAVTLTYQVGAAATGTYTIPPVQAIVDGQRIASPALSLNVVKVDPRFANLAFVTLRLPKPAFFVGESTAADLHLFFQGGRVVQEPSLRGEGATFGTNVPPSQVDRVTTNNLVYNHAVWRVPVTFVKAGEFQLRAEGCTLQVQLEQPRTRDRFGFPSIFPDFDTRNLQLTSDPVLVRVRPLPATNAPPDFTGAVGRFSLTASVSETNVTAGDPLTLNVRLAGTGNLAALRWSAPTNWTGIKTYEPASRVESSDPLGLNGARMIEQVLIPESPAVAAIPELRFSFFDPARERYQTLTHPGFQLNVGKGAARPRPTIPASDEPTEASEPEVDLVHIKTRPGPLVLVSPPLLLQPWFLTLQFLPLLTWLATLTWRRRRDYEASHPKVVRRRQVARMLELGLPRLRSCAQAGEGAAFHSELFRLLQEQLGERLDLPAASITGDIVDQRLRTVGVDPPLADAVESLFASCDQARYAPQSEAAALLSLLPQTEATLRGLARLEFPPTTATPPPRPTSGAGMALLLLAATLSLRGAEGTDAFVEANRLYEQGRYPESVAAYRGLLQTGRTSAALHFNLANALYRDGHVADALLHYRLAERLSPRDPDIRANLRFVRDSLPGNASVRSPIWQQQLERLRLNEWTLLFSAAFWAWCGGLALRQARPALRPRLRPWIRVLGLAALLCFTATALLWQAQRTPLAIARSPEVKLHFGPLEVSPVHYSVPAGTELRVVDAQGDWIQLSDAVQRLGWAPQTDLLRVPPP